jgi:hypothetical protein
VKCIKLGPGAHGLRILAKNRLASRRRIYHHNRHIPELNLINITESLRPMTVLFRRIHTNVPKIAYHGEAWGPFDASDARIVPDKLVDNDINKRRDDECNRERLQIEAQVLLLEK